MVKQPPFFAGPLDVLFSCMSCDLSIEKPVIPLETVCYSANYAFSSEGSVLMGVAKSPFCDGSEVVERVPGLASSLSDAFTSMRNGAVNCDSELNDDKLDIYWSHFVIATTPDVVLELNFYAQLNPPEQAFSMSAMLIRYSRVQFREKLAYRWRRAVVSHAISLGLSRDTAQKYIDLGEGLEGNEFWDNFEGLDRAVYDFCLFIGIEDGGEACGECDECNDGCICRDVCRSVLYYHK